ncbi:MAG TPA: VWA domain-containing protein, partial [Thermoanaerobaculia bacterium]
MTRLRHCSRGAAGLALGLLLAPALALAAGEAPAGESFKESIEVSVVNLDVYVTDKKGQPIDGLKKEDFQVLEDGKPVEISNFFAESRGTAPAAAPTVSGGPGPVAAERPVSQRLRLVVFVDDVNLSQSNRMRILQNVGKFLHSELKPGDEIMLVRYDHKLDIRRQFTPDLKRVDADLAEILDLPTDTRKYQQSLGQAIMSTIYARLGGERGGESTGGMEVESQLESWAGEESIMVSGSLDALDSVVSWLAGVPGRKAVLYVSDGLPITPGLDLYTVWSRAARQPSITQRVSAMNAEKYDMTARFRQLTAHASRNRVAFYPIESYGTRNGDSVSLFDSISLEIRQAGLRFLADDTGGRALLNATDVPGALAKVAEDFGTYYSIGYQPQRPGDEAEHKIEVKVKPRGAQVRYRRWYRDKPASETVAEATLAVMRFGPDDNPLGAKVEVVPSKKPGETLVRVQVPVAKLFLQPNGTSRQGQLRLYVVASGEGSTTPVRQTKLVTVEVPEAEAAAGSKKEYTHEIAIPLKPGFYALGVGIRDEQAAATSYLRREVTVGAVD